MLYIVATPIGNLEDITLRALDTLKNVDYIAAEDTRHTAILLNKYDIHKPLLSFHSYSDNRRLEEILQLLREGKKVALVSDAGTPGISDPGYLLIKGAILNNIPVIPIPGASAFLTALSASGLPTHNFVYLGFLPLKKGRKTLLESFKDEERTVIFYESPHRIIKTLEELARLYPERSLVLARELTKIHEEFVRGTTKEVLQYFQSRGVKGEFVVMMGPS